MTNDTLSVSRIEALYREATTCRLCFTDGTVVAPTIDIAQPRWIGAGYWVSSPRICVVMLNPGAGAVYNAAANVKTQALLQRFRSGEACLDEVFKLQRWDIQNWGRGGKFLKFLQTFSLEIDHIALVNIAWCATAGNQYPSWMLNACMQRFTRRLIDKVRPDVVVLSGGDVHGYEREIRHLLPNAAVIPTLHYAHRKGRQAELNEAQRFQTLLKAHHQ